MTMRQLNNDLRDNEDLLKLAEVAAMLRVHPMTVRRWGDQGLLPFYALGPRHIHRYRRGDIDRFIAQQRGGQQQTADRGTAPRGW